MPENALGRTAMNDAVDPYKPIEEILGAVLNLMATSGPYANRTLKDLHEQVLPPVVSGQYRLVRNPEGEAVAYASWARVSPEVERKIVEDKASLKPSEWQSGDIAVLIDLVSENLDLAQSMVMRLKRELFRDTTFKALRTNPKNKTTDWAEVHDDNGS